MSEAKVYLSAIDEERFGIQTARAMVTTPDDVAQVLGFCRTNRAVLLIARCPAAELRTVQRMEQQGFLLMDTLLYYVRHLAKPPIPEDRNASLIRPLRPGDEEQVREIATQSFKGYYGHYHADPRLDSDKCDEAYVSWAVRSATSREIADEVLVADIDGRLAGFATLRRNNDEEGEGVLYGVAPWAQGRGIYRSLMAQSLEWCQEQNYTHMLYSTQILNNTAQNTCTRLCFEMSHAYYTFHRWFDENSL